VINGVLKSVCLLYCSALPQELYSFCLEQLQEAHAEVQQTLAALQQPPCSAAAASAQSPAAAAAAAAAAGKAPDLAAKADRAITRMRKLLHTQHTVMRAKSESLVDYALPPRAADAPADHAVVLPAAPARVTRGSGKQQQAHEQRRAVRSNPVAAVLAVGRVLQQRGSDVQLLPGEPLGVHWHEDFKRLAEQLLQQQGQEDEARQAMQQLEVAVVQLQQQLQVWGQHRVAAGGGAEGAVAAATTATTAARVLQGQADDEEVAAGQAAAGAADAAAGDGAVAAAAVAAAASRQQGVGDGSDGGVALQDCSSGTAGAAAAAAADADSAHAGGLAAAAGAAGHAGPADAAAAAAAVAAVSSAEEQYAADRMAVLNQMHTALQSADVCMNALRQQNALLEQENARLRQQLAAAQLAAGRQPAEQVPQLG
jgi:hypothetical protein